MQEGGQTFVSPFAQPDPTGTTKARTPRQRPKLTFEAVTGIKREDTSPTITIGEDATARMMPLPFERSKEPDSDPGISNVSSQGYTAQSPEVAAAASNMGIQLTGFEDGSFYDTLAAMSRPETSFSKGADKFVTGVIAPIVTATLGQAFPPLGFAGTVMSAKGVIGSKDGILSTITDIFGGSKSKGTTTPTTSTATKAPVPISSISGKTAVVGNMTGTPFGSTKAPTFAGVSGMSTAEIGSQMFGPVYGEGGQVSPSFAIGGKGSYTSFSHWSAGVSQADEISIVSNAAPGVFASPESGKDAIDGLVSGGYNESEITSIATTGQYAGLNYAEGSNGSSQSLGNYAINEGKYSDTSGGDVSGDPGSPVICTQLFSMGIMSANLYQGEGEHAKNIPNVIRRGYHFWAVPFVRGMRKNQLLFKLGKTFGLSWAQYAAHKANPDKFEPNYLGTVINAIGVPICAALGLFVGETDWKTLWIDYEKGNGLCSDQQN